MSSSVTTKFKTMNFTGLIDDTTISRIQQEVVEGNIKKSIEVGLSPVQGYSRFAGYSGELNTKAKKGYPYSVQKKYPGKGLRPVNLSLSGDMLSYYQCGWASDQSVFIGILEDAPEDVKARADRNNSGEGKGSVARRFVPGPGETYSVGTMTLIRQILADRIVEFIDSQ